MTNPVFNEKVFQGERVITSEPMTINGTINKTIVSFGFLVLSSLFVWNLYFQGYMDKCMTLMLAGLIVGFILAMGISFRLFGENTWKITVPAYSIAEGLALGGISAQFEKMYPGIAIQAITMTFMALGTMLLLYRTGVIKCTEKFRSVLMTSMFSILGIYLISFIGGFFGLHIPQIFSSSPIGIGFSLIVVAVASLSLIMDFDFIERGAQNFLSKNYEWYGAFGLMVTLVWLYLEMLRLLSKFRDR